MTRSLRAAVAGETRMAALVQAATDSAPACTENRFSILSEAGDEVFTNELETKCGAGGGPVSTESQLTGSSLAKARGADHHRASRGTADDDSSADASLNPKTDARSSADDDQPSETQPKTSRARSTADGKPPADAPLDNPGVVRTKAGTPPVSARTPTPVSCPCNDTNAPRSTANVQLDGLVD